MKRLIYQVAVGPQSELYKKCIQSVKEYCEKYDITHIVQNIPLLMIKPDPSLSNRSDGASRLGYLPIFEKENAFEYVNLFDQIAIIDADIFIKSSSPNIFDDLTSKYAFGAVAEREMPLTPHYASKIKNYSVMQYTDLAHTGDYRPNALGFEFYNMGVMIINCEKFKPYLKGQSPREFLSRTEFQPFVDGIGNWKWSTDQTLLNYWVKREIIPTLNMNWKWNGLYKGVEDHRLPEAYFVHFFLKDKLPERGENVEQLMRDIGIK